MINLSAKPFYLNERGIAWVNGMLSSLSIEEKVGQIFNLVFSENDDSALESMMKKIPCGGITFRANKGEIIRRQVDFANSLAKIPLLISANLESGGSGIASDGTDYASQIEVAATGDPEYAYILGDICGKEGRAVGCNYAFAPVVDILFNWRNPIVNTRSYSDDPQKVLLFAKEYMRGIKQHKVAVSLKHFPGDGIDERDQHLVSSVNSLSPEDWDKTFGYVYRNLIEAGADTVMVGHILLPEYSKRLNPDLKDEDILPASLSKEIVTDLLRDRLGFNGAVITDSASMTGLGCAMKRKDIPAACINAGCDMFLFGRNAEEDYSNLLDSVQRGVVSVQRIDEAVTRILALKASLQLNEVVPDEYPLDYVGCSRHVEKAMDCAQKAITLVKNKENILPISADKYEKILLVVLGDEPSFRGGTRIKYYLKNKLEKEGFRVTLFAPEKSMDIISDKVADLQKKYDLILYAANVAYGGNDTCNRLKWIPFACGESPQLVNDIPTIFASFLSPFCLADVPMVKTYINCYNDSRVVVDAFADKLVGRTPFVGRNPVDPFCGIWGTDL